MAPAPSQKLLPASPLAAASVKQPRLHLKHSLTTPVTVLSITNSAPVITTSHTDVITGANTAVITEFITEVITETTERHHLINDNVNNKLP